MWIICQADDSHELSRLIFFEQYKKKINKKFKTLSAAVVIGTIYIISQWLDP